MKCKNSKISVRRWHKFFLILSLVVLHAISAFAQGQRIPERSIDIQEILSQYDAYFSSRTDEQNSARGSGFKPFKRWEWFVTPRAFPGASLNTGARWNVFQDILAMRAQNPQPTLGADWTSIGPSNIAGRMLDIALDPNDPDIIWAGSASGGIWKSPDAGSSWIAMDDQLPTLAIGCVVTHNTDSDIVYIGTGEGMFNGDAVSGVGVLKTTDGGSTWSQTGLIWQLSDNAAVNEMVMHPNNSAILIAATRDGVYRTTDSGANWSQTLSFSGPEDAKEVVIDPVDPNNVYAALGYPWGHANNGIYKSTDNGVTWAKLTNGLPADFNDVGRTSLAIHDNNPAILYAGISGSFSFNGSGLIGVYKTTDGGGSWTLQATSPNFYSSQGWYDNIIAVDPVDPDIVYSGGVGLYKSTNSGVSWANIGTAIHVDQHALMFHPSDHNTIIAGNDGGMYKSFNAGGTWLDINDGLTTMQFYAMGSDANDANKAFGGTQDNGTNRHDGSLLWDHVLGGDGGECNVDYTNSNIVYAEYQLGFHRKSTNGGNNWFSINSGLAGNGPWVTPVEMDPTDPEILYTIANANLYKTTTGGTSWSLLFPAGALSSSIRAAASDNQTIYASGFGAIYRTTDGGATWTDITSGLSSVAITSISVHPNDPQLLYVGMSGWSAGNHIFKSFDGGDNWQNVTNDLPNIPCNTLVLDPAFPDHVYVGTDLGVYLSTDGAGSWAEWNTGLANVVIDELDIHQASGVIRAATHGRGMYQSPLFVPTGFDALIWIHSDVTDPNVAEKASRRGLTTEEVEAMVAAPTSHTALAAALAANGMTVLTVSDLTSVTLSDFEAVFAVVGIFPNNHVIPAGGAEATAIVNYISAGGSMYMEGGDMWASDPVSAGGHDFGPLFGINGLNDGAGDLSTVLGVAGTFTEGLDYTYSGDNNFIDRIEPASTGFTVHENSSPSYDCGIANSTSGYHTIGNAFQFGGLDDVVTNQTKQELMAAYLNFFGTPVVNPPDIEVDPLSFDVTLPPGGTTTEIMTIGNVGDENLEFDIIDRETNGGTAEEAQFQNNVLIETAGHGASPQNLGDVVHQIPAPEVHTSDLTWDGQYLWICPSFSGIIYQLDPADGSIVNSFSGPGSNLRGLAWDGTYLWTDEWFSDKIYKLDPTNGTILQSFNAPAGDSPTGLTFDDDGFLWNCNEETALIYKIDPTDGSVITSINAPEIDPRGLTWDGAYLWVAFQSTDNIYQIEPADGSIVKQFISPHPIPQGLAFDGQYLWNCGTSEATIYQIDIEHVSADAPWLSEAPNSGSVPPGGNAPINVNFNASGLSPGDYFADILINSNDPDEPQVVVPVKLNVVTEATDALIWIPEDVIEPDLARKAAERELSIEVIEGLVASPTSHIELKAALEANGRSALITNTLAEGDLTGVTYLFVVLGIFPNNHVILAAGPEAGLIEGFIAAGGKVYMEGGDMWYFDPQFLGGHDFGPSFSIDPLEDGDNDLKTLLGFNIAAGKDFTYSGQNNFIDRLQPFGPAFTVHANTDPAYDCGVGNESPAGSRTIGNSFEFGGLDDASLTGATKTALMADYLDFFDNGVSLETASFDFPLTEGGWYLISLPVISEDSSVNSLFPAAIAAFGWDFATQSYVPATALQPGQGYWLAMPSAATVDVIGLPFTSYNRTYTQSGWDMLGAVMQKAGVNSEPNGNVFAMFGYNPLTGSYEPVNAFKPKQGYWLAVLASAEQPLFISIGSGGTLSTGLAKSGSLTARYGAAPPGLPPFVIAEEGLQAIPTEYGLSQNYPNPFNPETVIEYQLPEASRVSLKIYTILGQEVRTLVDEAKQPGVHRARWDGNNDAGKRLASGVYVYRIQARDASTGSGQRFVLTKKLVMLK